MNEFKVEYYNIFEVNTDKEKWYKLLCYYHALTELYDRTLTDMRSPYDKTEAYIVHPTHRIASNLYANKLRKEVVKIAEELKIPDEYISFKVYKNYSAQKWINEYERFKENGNYDNLTELS